VTITRRHFLLLPMLLAACSDATVATATPFAPAADRPTFIFFYAHG
jgi:hypothetical protein